jgi:hypothetical protein
MTHEALDHVHPVEIAALAPQEHGRTVRIEWPGTTPVVVVCSSRRLFEEVLGRERPGIGPDDEQLVHRADHPGEWPSA